MSGRECFEHLDNLIGAWGVLDRGGILRMDECEVIWIGLYWKVMRVERNERVQ